VNSVLKLATYSNLWPSGLTEFQNIILFCSPIVFLVRSFVTEPVLPKVWRGVEITMNFVTC